MGQTVNVNFKLDLDIKKKMESACESMGLSLSTAFALFARKVGNGNCEIFLPFFNFLKNITFWCQSTQENVYGTNKQCCSH